MPAIAEPDGDSPYPHPAPGHPGHARYDFHERTVSRRLVHRSSVAEVLITGWQATGPYDFLLGAQWPRLHGFYRLPGDRHHDPVLMAETIRQAALLIGHVGFGVPHDHHYALDELSYALGPAGLDGLAIAPAPAALMLRVGCQDVRMRHGRLAALRVHAEIERDGRPVGRGSGELRVLSPGSYARLRGPGRPAPAPRPPESCTAPELVGRQRAADVVLGPSLLPGSWLLRADADHPALFDRMDPAPDHVPGMLVLEAARQAAQRLCHPARVAPVELVTSFHAPIALDRPCLVRAVREPAPESGPGAGRDVRRLPVRVLLVQDGRTVAECRLLAGPADGGPTAVGPAPVCRGLSLAG
ncbi:ScbA/BarX family gamma-butyrolactone biosynthesis protein [Streptomyces sp. BE303]|uniref:ScbA/BarX family gamma-butyrolactone biosynthesis protein n=1 Tax=Streptomyces sp. BE303 TaxID=3002528 RepID=UPI002E78DE10|nr:ScbA/BarX family gamma-butyrolactone biosynthesis protein [Streptomyces sp. BE303]MED7951620.1 ScbA/BarX family gamma-butyrolactone biosynthesis protein [Streptomyces sp. BE303]